VNASDELKATVESLAEKSRKAFYDPYTSLTFPDSVGIGEEWFTAPEFISMHGTESYDALNEQQQKTLSFYEAVNFFSLNIHGERMLLEGLAHRLYDAELRDVAKYLHHFLDEENKHMIYFATFCLRYAGKIYPDRKVIFPREYAPGEEHFLFFGRVMIFEEVVDYFNRHMGRDERLATVAREINRLHHADESRHLVFGRRIVKELFDHFRPAWSEATLEGVRTYLGDYFRVVWREYYNRDVYRDAGLEDSDGLARRLFEKDESRRAFRQRVAKSSVDYLLKIGVLTEEPKL
jgi:P-aminobenzoate N-oxygenase AurF